MGVQAMKHAALLREWTARFAECRSSGMTVKAWCEAQGLSIKTYYYVKVGDYYFPNFALPPDTSDIGFWGRRRREFLREHRPITFKQMVLSGELFKYLAQFNQEATERLESCPHP